MRNDQSVDAHTLGDEINGEKVLKDSDHSILQDRMTANGFQYALSHGLAIGVQKRLGIPPPKKSPNPPNLSIWNGYNILLLTPYIIIYIDPI